MLENKVIKAGKYYIYVFEKCFDNEFMQSLIVAGEQRFLKLKDIVCPGFQAWKRPYYIIEATEKEPRGYAYSGMIKCQIPVGHKEDLPMVHEETHMITFQMLGEMSYAWSEGFAEYYVCILKGSTGYLEGENADFAKLRSRDYYNDILYSLTHENTEHFNWLRWNNIFYSMSLASFIHFVRVKLGEEGFQSLLKMVIEKNYIELDLFLKEEINKWFDWIEKQNCTQEV